MKSTAAEDETVETQADALSKYAKTKKEKYLELYKQARLAELKTLIRKTLFAEASSYFFFAAGTLIGGFVLQVHDGYYSALLEVSTGLYIAVFLGIAIKEKTELINADILTRIIFLYSTPYFALLVWSLWALAFGSSALLFVLSLVSAFFFFSAAITWFVRNLETEKLYSGK